MNDEVRDREKVMRGLKRMDSPIIKGLQIYHNLIRPHESLNGDTPAEVAGVNIGGKNKWLELLKSSLEPSKKSPPPADGGKSDAIVK